MKYKYKGAVALAALISAGACGGAWAQDWSNGGQVLTTDSPSPAWTLVAVDGAGNPVDTSSINPDGSFKAGCVGCGWVDPATLTQAQRDAIAADPNAGVFDTKTSRLTNVQTDSYTGDNHSTTQTYGGVQTGEKYTNGAGSSTSISADGVNTTGNLSGGTVTAGGRDVGSSLSAHDVQIGNVQGQANATDGRLNNFNGTGGSVESWGTGVDGKLANHDSRIGSLEDKTQTLTGDANGMTANGNFTVQGKATLNGGADVNGGLNVTGGTTTDTLHVTGKSVFDDAVTVNTSTGSSTVTGGGASFTDASGGNTTISGGDVTSTGTISGAKVLAGGRDVGQSLADHDATLANHDTRITHVQNQADATDHRLNDFNGTGGTVESWATGVDNWRVDTNAWRADMTGWRDDVNTTLSNYGSRISSLEGWRNVASAQISNLQGRMDKVEGGIALAMASKVPSLETGKTFGVTLNTAFTDSTGAIAGGLAFRLDKNWQINASGGAGFKGGAAGGTVGIVGQW